MSGSKHSHKAPAAFILFAFTLAFVGYVFYSHPDFEKRYFGFYVNGFKRATHIASNILGFNTSVVEDPNVVSITEFGTTTEIAIITDQSLAGSELLSPAEFASSTDPFATSTDPAELTPTELEGFKPSPESEWASLYLMRLERTQESLGLNIQYVREWQQTGGLYRDLAQGSKGTDVKLMQYLLSAFDPKFKRSSVTGTFGPQTKSALASFQKKLNIKPTGIFDNETRFFFDSIYFKELCPDADPEQDKSYENVNRRISVPLDYIPSDLIRVPRTVRSVGVMCLSKEPAKRLEEMFTRARTEGYELAVFSAYRSSKTQKLLTQYYLDTLGKAGLAGVAEAGHSEHQLGTTVDVSGQSIKYQGPTELFGTSPEGRWLQENSYKFGFIMSYPQGRQQDTGYIYEPWHFRYVGVDTARDIFEEKLTIQEYFNLVKGESLELEKKTNE